MKTVKIYHNTLSIKSGLSKTKLILSVTCLLSLLFSCKKSFKDGVVFTIGTNNFKYTALVKVRDAAKSNIAPGNLSVAITGPDAASVYDLSTGKSKLKINPDGTIQLLIAPTRLPGNAVNFNLSVSSPGYLPVMQPVTITSADSSQVIAINMHTVASGKPAGSTAGVAQFALKNNAMPAKGVIKLGANNTMKVTQGGSESAAVQSARAASRRSLASTGAGTSDTDTTYYDDGLTSVVLPKGTAFHYYTIEPTGVMLSDTFQMPHVTAKTIAVTGAAIGTITEYQTYYTQEIVTFPQTVYVSHTANTDSIAVVLDYGPAGSDITTKVEYGATQAQPSIGTLSNGNVLKDELLFKSVVSERLYGNPRFYSIHHETKKSWYDSETGTYHDNETVPPFIVYDQLISPDQDAHWFTSFLINPLFINPATGKTLEVGDLVEIGIDPVTNQTIRQSVELADGNQLRTQMLSYDAGFFYQAPVVEAFNYTLDPTTTVADPENAFSNLNVLGLYSFGFTGGDFSPFNLQGKIASFYQQDSKTEAIGYYWGKQVFDQSYSLSGTISPFGFSPPYATVKFNILATTDDATATTVVVDDKPKSGKNYGAVTLYTYFITPNGGGVVNIRNGQWATNFLQVGSNISGTGYFDSFELKLNSYNVQTYNNMYWDAPKFN